MNVRVNLVVSDNYPIGFITDEPAGYFVHTVSVPEAVLERWQRVLAEYQEVQGEMIEAFETATPKPADRPIEDTELPEEQP